MFSQFSLKISGKIQQNTWTVLWIQKQFRLYTIATLVLLAALGRMQKHLARCRQDQLTQVRNLFMPLARTKKHQLDESGKVKPDKLESSLSLSIFGGQTRKIHGFLETFLSTNWLITSS